jgi:hypothetical protein
MKTIAAQKTAAPAQLTWTHLGALYRITAWPEAQCELLTEGVWSSFEADPAGEAVAAAAVMLEKADWKRYLEFVPAGERGFLETFKLGRMAALIVISRCPQLLFDLEAAPALTSFLAAHMRLRGSARAAWTEIGAVHERSGIFGVLQWLGLPATRIVLETLQNFAEPDIARRLLDRVRASLWSPLAPSLLRASGPLSETELMTRCDVIAA